MKMRTYGSICILLCSWCVAIVSSAPPSLQASVENEISLGEKELINLEKTIRMREDAKKDKALMDQQQTEEIIKKEIDKLLSSYASDKREDTKSAKKEEQNSILEDAKKIIDLKKKEETSNTKQDTAFDNAKKLLKEILLEDNDIAKDDLPQKDEKKDDNLTIEEMKELFKLYKDTEKRAQEAKNDEKKIIERSQQEEKDEDDESKMIIKLLQKKEAEDETSCRDVLSARDCYQLAFNGTCSTHRKEMEKRCKRSCRFCCADSPGAPECMLIKSLKNPQETCNDKNYHERLRITCPKLCRFCGRAMAEVPCVRTKYGCCWDGSIAKNHLGTEDDGCPACKNYREEIFCQRFQKNCRHRYTAGDQMRKICPRTCRRCGPHIECEDDPNMLDTCKTMKYEGLCEKSFNLMKYMCPKTCGICNKSTISCEKTRYGCCKDGVTISRTFGRSSCPECNDVPGTRFDCGFLKRFNVCNSHKKLMSEFCAGTCEFCKE